jgi:hypothetical protein
MVALSGTTLDCGIVKTLVTQNHISGSPNLNVDMDGRLIALWVHSLLQKKSQKEIFFDMWETSLFP